MVQLSNTTRGHSIHSPRERVITMMRHWIATILAIVLTVPLLRAADDKKKPDDPKDNTASPQNNAALEQAHEAIGTIVSVDAGSKSLVFRLEYQRLEMTGKPGNANVGNLMRQQQQNMRATNPIQRAMQMQRMQQQIMRAQAANNAKVVTEHMDFDLQGTGDVKVRMKELPPRVDTAGKPKPYSDIERERGKYPDPDLPGFHADFEGLSEGMLVKVTLGHSKSSDKDSGKVPVKLIIIQPAPKTAPAESPKDKK